MHRLTTPEKVIYDELVSRGVVFSVGNAKIKGRPDFFIPSLNTLVFVDGCFWHAHHGCPNSSLPKRNAMEWLARFNTQKLHDERITNWLIQEGYRVKRIWECDVNQVEARQSLLL